MTWKLITGPFAGCVVEEETILDVAFLDLDEDLQERIELFAKDLKIGNLEEAKELYELSWESRECEQEADLLPVSRQLSPLFEESVGALRADGGGASK